MSRVLEGIEFVKKKLKDKKMLFVSNQASTFGLLMIR